MRGYIIGSAAIHALLLVGSAYMGLRASDRSRELAARRAIDEHAARYRRARSAEQLSELREMLEAVERRAQSVPTTSESARPGDSEPRRSALEEARELAARIDELASRHSASARTGEPAKPGEKDAAAAEFDDTPELREIAALHERSRETVARLLAERATASAASSAQPSSASSSANGVSLGGNAPGGEVAAERSGRPGSAVLPAAAETPSVPSATGAYSSPQDGWVASFVSERWQTLDRTLRGPALLAEQRKRWALAAYNADLDGELSDVKPWLKSRRTFLGAASGAAWFFVGSWYVLGPFDNSERKHHDTHFPPETLLDLDAVYAGKGGRALRWTHRQSATLPIVPLDEDAYAIYYAYSELRSDRERRVWLAVAGDDSIKLWLNHELIWTSAVHLKPWVIAEGFVRATLRPGYNTVLLRLENAPQGAAFSLLVRIEP